MNPIHTTARGTRIYVQPGQKSTFDFIVRYQEPTKRMRTPKHIHLIVDLYAKHAANPSLTMDFVQHLVSVFRQLQPARRYPPSLQVFRPAHVQRFQGLAGLGEYDVEFLLAVSELVMLQEKTNYPAGSITERVLTSFGRVDIFTIVSIASWRG